jgi:hypothetical protein
MANILETRPPPPRRRLPPMWLLRAASLMFFRPTHSPTAALARRLTRQATCRSSSPILHQTGSVSYAPLRSTRSEMPLRAAMSRVR